jgi:hypothetical protein
VAKASAFWGAVIDPGIQDRCHQGRLWNLGLLGARLAKCQFEIVYGSDSRRCYDYLAREEAGKAFGLIQVDAIYTGHWRV